MVIALDHNPQDAQLALWRQRHANQINGRMYIKGYTDGMAAYPDNDPAKLAYGLAHYRRQAQLKQSCCYELGIYQALLVRTGR